jgi:hypothetical protein
MPDSLGHHAQNVIMMLTHRSVPPSGFWLALDGIRRSLVLSFGLHLPSVVIVVRPFGSSPTASA